MIFYCNFPAVSNGDLDDYDKGVLIFYLPFRILSTMVGLARLATPAAMAKELPEDTRGKLCQSTRQRNIFIVAHSNTVCLKIDQCKFCNKSTSKI